MHSKTIMLVEDNPNDEALTLRVLHKLKLAEKIVVVRDGAEALDYLWGRGQYAGSEPPEIPRVILLDLKLPKLNGLEVLERLRAFERTRRLPVVILTSSSEEDDILRSYSLGANSYIRKPVDFVKFNEAIQQVGQYWLQLNELPPA